MSEIPEKSKRKEKPKGTPGRNFLGLATGLVVIFVAGAFGYILALAPGSPSQFELTATSIMATNAEVAVLLSQTSEAQLTSTRLMGMVQETTIAGTASYHATETAERTGFNGTLEPEYFSYNLTATESARVTTIALTDVTDGGGDAMITREPTRAPMNVQATTLMATRYKLTEIAATEETSMQLTARAGVTPTPTRQSMPVCFYRWSTEIDVEATSQIQAALEDAGIQTSEMRVSADGEDQMCTDNGTPTTTFLVMDRSIYITVPMDLTDTRTTLGQRVEAILRAIEDIVMVKIDRPRNIGIQFATSGVEPLNWLSSYGAAYEALNAGKTGAELWAAGGGR